MVAMTRTLWKSAVFAAVSVTALGSGVLHAQTLPDARAVLARYAKATNAAKVVASGGHASVGTFSMAGFSGPAHAYTDERGRSAQVVTLAGVGEIRQGVDTNFAWSLDPSQGPKLIEGREFAEMRERYNPRAMLRDPAIVTGAETLARVDVQGETCISVKLSWKSGRTTTECYSEKTGLLLSVEGVEQSSMGAIPFTTLYSEYKEFNGVTLPTKSVQRAVGTEVTMIISSVTLGPVDPAKLALPAEIQALRGK
jgi:hypothetical protein